MSHKFPYRWSISDGYPAKGIRPNGLKVFSCFACGGGSTMGYKLAGYDVLGCNEIDPKLISAYRANHKPKYSFLEPIQDFKNRKEFPDDLMNLDILDGSPPCSSFSMVGSREAKWGIKKKFREGQAEQVLDNLFFDFLDLAERLKPKVIVAENVQGMIVGNAKIYVKKIKKRFEEIGYSVQLFLLDASTMGVPQRRKRVFFIANRMGWGKLSMDFREDPIPFSHIRQYVGEDLNIRPKQRMYWNLRKKGDSGIGDVVQRIENKSKYFSHLFAKDEKVLPTITASDDRHMCLFDEPRYLRKVERQLGGSYPLDYNFGNNRSGYLIGMSVPPVMAAQVSNQIRIQWFDKEGNNV
jgi:DNA (cytosine-5)-methyltransferase 1